MNNLVDSNLGRLARIFAAGVACSALVACGDAAGPRDPSSTRPLPAAITEWSASEPQYVQRGVFTYDASKRLTRYDFGMIQADGSHRITYYVLYEYAGERLVRTETYVRDGAAFVHVGEADYSYDAFGRVQKRLRASLDEVTGAVQRWTTEYQYDASDRVTTILDGDERTLLTYDAAGNIVSEEVVMPGSSSLVYQYEYGTSLNPFADLHPQRDPVLLLNPFGRGDYNLTRWTANEAGQPPASTATITYELNELGYPTRVTVMAVNTDFPDVPMTFVSTIEYVQ